MQTLRQGLTLLLAAALVWVGVAGGLLSANAASSSSAASQNQHAHNLFMQHAHHDATLRPDPVPEASAHQQTNRDCARSCLGSVSAKLVPAAVSLQPPHLIAVMVAYCDPTSIIRASRPVSAFSPSAPPDWAGEPPTGAARILSRHSHLRI